MSLFPESAYQLELPKMHRVLQKFDTTQLENVEETLRAEMHKKEISSLVKPGMRIAMAVGSRGIQEFGVDRQNYCGRIAEHGSNTVYRSGYGIAWRRNR